MVILSRFWSDHLTSRLRVPPHYAWRAALWFFRGLSQTPYDPFEHAARRTIITGFQSGGSVSPCFLSLAIDVSMIIGGSWWEGSRRVKRGLGARRVAPLDLDDRRLAAWARAFGPAYLRIGGTEADTLYYDTPHTGRTEAPGDYRHVLSQPRWDEVCHFAQATGLRLMMTVAAGAGPRDRNGQWQPDNAAALLAYTRRRNYPVDVWELGNEVNGFRLMYGFSSKVGPSQYSADYRRFLAMVRRTHPSALAAGPSSAVWPIIGEVFPIMPSFLRETPEVDLVTWHYYPQQSRRGPIATRRATPTRLLDPAFLDEAGGWARRVRILCRRAGVEPSRAWLGETGHALFGGQPGVSDRFVSILWWLDQLGLMARSGVPVVIRQTLIGSDYGLLNFRTTRPNPDAWASLLWKQLMGPRVLRPVVARADRLLRLYAHETASATANTHQVEPATKGLTLLAVNLGRKPAVLRLEGVTQRATGYLLSAPHILSETVHLNGTALTAELPQDLRHRGVPVSLPTEVPPRAALFLVLSRE